MNMLMKPGHLCLPFCKNPVKTTQIFIYPDLFFLLILFIFLKKCFCFNFICTAGLRHARASVRKLGCLAKLAQYGRCQELETGLLSPFNGHCFPNKQHFEFILLLLSPGSVCLVCSLFESNPTVTFLQGRQMTYSRFKIK